MKEEAEQIDEVFYTVRGHDTGSIGSPTKFIGSAISKALDHTKAGRKVTVKSHDHENGHIDSVTINPGDHVKRAIEGLKKVREPVKEEAEQIDEAIKIGSRVKIHAPGKDYHGVVGNVGEIDHGLHNKSIKRYTVDYDNRSKSITVPKPQVKLHTEEAEQIAELKHNGILSRYIRAVRPDVDDDVASPKRKAGYHMALKKKWGDKKYGFDEPRVKATNEEAEQIDELKKSTLASYTKKASNDATKHSYMAGKTGDVDTAAKASKRIRGIDMATNKLAKEEFSDAELARLEEIAAKFDIQESPATERGLQDHEPRIVSGVKGMKSKSFSKKFPHAKAMEKWMDSDDYGNHEVHRIERA